MTADPFEVLRAADERATPPPAFVNRLRAQLAATLDAVGLPTVEIAAPAPSRATNHARSTTMLVPYISVHDAAAAIDWYTSVFGANEEVRYVGDDGRVGHAQLAIGDATLYLADEYPEYDVVGPRRRGGTSVSLHLQVDDVDAVYAAALGAGAESRFEPSDQPYGARGATIVDPFGHRWQIQTVTGEPTSEEITAAMDGFTVVETPPAQPAAAPIEVGYLTFAVPDTARAAQFYAALFGWASEPGHLGNEYVHVPNTKLPMGITPGPVDDRPALYYRVPSLAPYVARVRELGGEVLNEAVWESGPGAECRDDQGRTFHLWEPAPGY